MKLENKKPVTIAEVAELVKDMEDKKTIHDYVKKFSNLDLSKAKKLADEVRALNNPKIKEENVIKIVDFLPKDSEDVNKILTEVSLNEEEINSILQLTEKY